MIVAIRVFFASLNSFMKKLYVKSFFILKTKNHHKMFCKKDFLFFKKYFLAIKITDKTKCEIGCSDITWDIGIGRMPFLKDFEGSGFRVSFKIGCFETKKKLALFYYRWKKLKSPKTLA